MIQRAHYGIWYFLSLRKGDLRFRLFRAWIRFEMSDMASLRYMFAHEAQEIIAALLFSDFGKMLNGSGFRGKFVVATQLAVVKYAQMILPIESIQFPPREDLPGVIPRNEMVPESLFGKMRFEVFKCMPWGKPAKTIWLSSAVKDGKWPLKVGKYWVEHPPKLLLILLYSRHMPIVANVPTRL